MTLPRVQTRREDRAVPSSAKSVHVVTFGCQMNKYDSLLVEGRFRAHGYRLTDQLSEADVVLFNTCSVREHAEERVFSWLGELREAKRARPELVVGVLGCMAQRAESEIFRRAGHVDLVCGTRKIQHLPELVEEVQSRRRQGLPAREQRLLEVGLDEAVAVERQGEEYAGGPAGYLTVMRGCDLNCSFCIVPRVRGRVQSRPLPDLLREARWMVAGGARVITLLGQTVNSYGEDLPRPGAGEERGAGREGRPALADVLYALEGLDGLERVRLITLHPSYVTHALARALAECRKVDRFLPLPAQSGSDQVLRRMRRGYSTELYRARIALLREAVPDLELGSDWIVGFPGESATDFEASLAFLREIGSIQNFVFQYSPRPDTRAFVLSDDVPPEVKKERNHHLLRVSEEVALARHQRSLGTVLDVFAEELTPDGRVRGRSRHNLAVTYLTSSPRLGRAHSVRIEGASPFGLWGVAESTAAPVQASLSL
jgi:tRNA-2-methylthio-N6-dimethylallyladenosine synthase